jgi:DNA-binding CsgD family transcriptional regulator
MLLHGAVGKDSQGSRRPAPGSPFTTLKGDACVLRKLVSESCAHPRTRTEHLLCHPVGIDGEDHRFQGSTDGPRRREVPNGRRWDRRQCLEAHAGSHVAVVQKRPDRCSAGLRRVERGAPNSRAGDDLRAAKCSRPGDLFDVDQRIWELLRFRNADGLTRRELEVLEFVAAGKTNREIANELFLSVRTVDRHLARIFEKLQVKPRAAAASQFERARAEQQSTPGA